MDLFASDLDNTLIYSYKRDIGTDTVCAEVYEGRQVSFMTKRSRELLEKVNQTMHFVPVTTRSVQQYERIRFGDTWSPRLALAANGGGTAAGRRIRPRLVQSVVRPHCTGRTGLAAGRSCART